MRSSIPDKEKSFKGKYKIKFFSQVTEDKGKNPEKIVLCLDGDVLAEVIKKDGKLVSMAADADVQDSGLLKDFASSLGIKEKDIVYTSLGMATAQSSVDHAKNKDKSDDKMKKSMVCNKTRLLKCWKSMKKSKQDGLYNIHVDGQIVNSRPMTIKEIEQEHGSVGQLESDPSIRVKEHAPKEKKPSMPSGSRLLKSYQKLRKDVIDFKSRKKIGDTSPKPKESKPSVDALRSNMRQKPQMSTMSRDEKIRQALDRQSGTNPFASQRQDASYGSSFTTKKDNAPRKNPFSAVKNEKSKMGLESFVSNDEWDMEQASHFASAGHHEPYVGKDYHNIGHKTHPESDATIAIPVFGKVDPKGHLGKHVAQGGPDPFSWVDSRHGVSKHVLKEHQGRPLKISTRSDLIAHDDYIKHLDPDMHEVNMHIPSSNDRVVRQLEPGAPSLKRRMAAVKKLHDAGIKVNIIHDKISDMEPGLNNVDRDDLLAHGGFSNTKPSDKAIFSSFGAKGRKIGLLENKIAPHPGVKSRLERLGLSKTERR